MHNDQCECEGCREAKAQRSPLSVYEVGQGIPLVVPMPADELAARREREEKSTAEVLELFGRPLESWLERMFARSMPSVKPEGRASIAKGAAMVLRDLLRGSLE